MPIHTYLYIQYILHHIYLFIYTQGTTSTGQTYTYRQFNYTKNTKYTFIYMLFCWFWTSEFITAIGQIAIALSFVSWYFTRNKNKVGSGTVLWVSNFCVDFYLRFIYVLFLLFYFSYVFILHIFFVCLRVCGVSVLLYFSDSQLLFYLYLIN